VPNHAQDGNAGANPDVTLLQQVGGPPPRKPRRCCGQTRNTGTVTVSPLQQWPFYCNQGNDLAVQVSGKKLDKPGGCGHDPAQTALARCFGGPMSDLIEFKSHVSLQQRPALEALVFFNSCQGRVAGCIADAVAAFGAPEIVADRDRLRIQVADLHDVQSLFAIEKTTGRPVGVAVYMRPDLEQITVMHLSLAAEYASGGFRSDEQLLLRLLREVRRSIRLVKGVRRLELFYVKGRGVANRWRATDKAIA
jgi:hypothetical protein